MHALVALLLLILISPSSHSQPRYALTPELPPTAFLKQNYACQFQVTGLTTPRFSFKGLPEEFTWDSSGLVKGTPLTKGSFSVTISFTGNSFKGSRQSILRVAVPSNFPVNSNFTNEQFPAFSISANIDTYVFMAGTQVSMQFSAVMGKQPYLWTYLRLPLELSGTTDGSLSGFFQQEGYFTFGVLVADSNGQSSYSFFTLNIQPFTFFTQWQPQALRQITDVPPRDTFSIPASEIAWKNYQIAAQLVSNATITTNDSHKALIQAQKNMSKVTYALQLAKRYVQASQQQLAAAKLKRDQAQKYLNKTALDLAALNRILAQKQSAFALAQYSAKLSQTKLKDIQSIFTKLTQLLKKASSQLSEAQSSLTAATSDLQKAQMGLNDSQDNLSNTLSAKDMASLQFQSVTLSSQKIFSDVDKARGAVQQNKLAVSQAQDAFNLANDTATNALKVLREANDEVSSLSRASNTAKNDVGQANMRLAFALNQLYVATAAKQQADKAIAIVSSQITNTENITFYGCSQGAYPSSFGSGIIQSAIPQGFVLQSNQRLLLGNCTLGQTNIYTPGDIVSFQGYLRNGAIHAIKLSKLI